LKSLPTRFLSVALAITFATTVAISANSPVLAHPAGKSLKTLRWYGLSELGGAQWAATLDPSQITDSVSYNIANMIYSNLVKLLPDGSVAPGLAQKWSESKNHLTYTFTLRKNLHFSNGDKLTASDVDFSITRALLKSTASPVALLYDGHIVGAGAVNSGKTNKLKGIQVVNSRVLKITLDKPIVYFLKTLTYPTADVLDPKVVGGKPAQTYITNTCTGNVGDGPFKYKCRNNKTDPNHSGWFKPGSSVQIQMVPNPKFYGPKPKINISMKVYNDAQANYKAFQNNQVDVSFVPTSYVSSLRGKPGFFDFPTSITDYMTPNEHADSQFKNVHCRLAIAYAINRNAIDKQVLRGTQVATYQVLPQNLKGFYNKGFVSNKSWAPHYDLKKAKAELKKCPSGLKNVVIPYQHTSVDIDNEYGAIVQMINNLGSGVHASLKPLTFNQWLGVVGGPSLDKTVIGKVDLTENLWIEDYPDPQDYMTNLLRSGANYDIGGFNNSTYNALVDKAEICNKNCKVGKTTYKTRADLYTKAQKIALNAGAWIAIGNQHSLAVVREQKGLHVKGLVGSAAYGIMVPKADNWASVSITK